MADKRLPPPPWWLFLILCIGALATSAIYVGKALVVGATTGTIVRLVIWGALGCFWLFMSRHGKRKKRILDDATRT